MSRALSVERLPAEEHGRWEAFVAGSPDGSAYSLPRYLDALVAAVGGSYRIVAATREDGEIAGGVALYERPAAVGRFVSPRLLLYYNGLVLRSYPTRYPSERTSRHVETARALAEALDGLPYSRLELRSRSTISDLRPFLDRGWRVAPGYTYVVPLDDLAAQWSLVAPNLRRLVQRCARDGMAVSADDDFDAFYRAHHQTHERKEAPLYLDEARFRGYYERLRAEGLCRLYHARLPDGRTVSSQLVLLGHPVTHTVAAATDPGFLRTGATAFLRWRTLEHLAASGFRANDLTDASLSSVAHFKSQLGGTLETWLAASRRDTLSFRVQQRAYRWARRGRSG